MNAKCLFGLIFAFQLSLGWSLVSAEFPDHPTWTTVLRKNQNVGGIVVDSMEGLTGDDNGKFYVADRKKNTCNAWEIDTNTASVSLVGKIGAAGCRPSGITFGPNGALYIASSPRIYRLVPGPDVSAATVYARNVFGANGIAFLGNDLFVTDGTQNQGRVWKITGSGADCKSGSEVKCEEFLRIPPRRNGTKLGGNVNLSDRPDGVGAVRYTVPRQKIAAPTTADRQDIVANGVAFTANGEKIIIADTARGAIWEGELQGNGELEATRGCDPTFHPNSLCMDSLYVAHPLLEGVDGIVLLTDGTILASVNERNAIVAVGPDKSVTDVFQNATDKNLLRTGDGTPDRPLEFPTSPFVSGQKFCTTNADYPRRDNNPNAPGEGSKVVCLDQNLQGTGAHLPIQSTGQ